MNILLIGNLPQDRQESMQRFTDALRDGISERGHTVNVVAPALHLARLVPNYRYNGLPKYLGYFDKLVLFPRTLRRHIAESRPDVVHLTDHAGAIYEPSVRGTPLLATCHDLLQVGAAQGDANRPSVGRAGRYYQNWIQRGLTRVPHIACVSRLTREDTLRFTGQAEARVTVIPNALNYPFAPIPLCVSRERLATLAPALAKQSAGGFLLQIGGEQWYKNRAGLLAIYAALRGKITPAPRLVMVGPPLSALHAALAAKLGVSSHITQLTSVSGEQLEALYNLAEGLLFPSLAEGFGWPIAEAQACGCPVFASNREPMIEVGGRHAVYFDPTAPAEAAQTIASAWPSKNTLIGPAFVGTSRWRPSLMIDAYVALYRHLSR